MIEGAQASGANSQVVRERDLEGHLAEEGQVPAPTGSRVVVQEGKKTASARDGAMGSAADIPPNPVKGSDFALSVGYQLLVKNIGEAARKH